MRNPALLEVLGETSALGEDIAGGSAGNNVRLSPALISDHIEKIRELLGLPGLDACDIDCRKTLVVDR
jgi:hypothetical protein